MKTFDLSQVIIDPEGNEVTSRDPNVIDKTIKIIEGFINRTPSELDDPNVEPYMKIAKDAVNTRNEVVGLLENLTKWTLAKVLYLNYAKNNQSKDYDEIMFADRLGVNLLSKPESVEMSDKEIKLLKERVISLDIASFIKAKLIRMLES